MYAEAGACAITAGTGILVRHAWRAEGIEFQFAFLCMVSVVSCMMSWHVALLFCPLHVGCRLRVVWCLHSIVSAEVIDFQFSPFDDSLLATSSADCTVKLWQVHISQCRAVARA